MNRNKVIILSLSLLLSNYSHASASRTCLQRSYREIKKIVAYTVVGTYVHQNIMTQQDLTKFPNLTVEDVTDYKNKLGATLQNGCASLDNSYTSLKKLLSNIKPQPKASLSFTDLYNQTHPEALTVNEQDQATIVELEVAHNDTNPTSKDVETPN